jgi:hypothetical protein
MLKICFTLFHLANNLRAVLEGLIIISVVGRDCLTLKLVSYECFSVFYTGLRSIIRCITLLSAYLF